MAHPSFRVISTVSKSLPIKDWLSDEHANMLFAVPSQPMDRQEESLILARTGCPEDIVEKLRAFAEKYRQSISEDTVQKSRKLGTRSLARIARRIAKHPNDLDLRRLLNQTLLAEFLPVAERMNLNTLLEDSTFKTSELMVRASLNALCTLCS